MFPGLDICILFGIMEHILFLPLRFAFNINNPIVVVVKIKDVKVILSIKYASNKCLFIKIGNKTHFICNLFATTATSVSIFQR